VTLRGDYEGEHLSTTSPELTRARGESTREHRSLNVRRSTETKASFKTTEFAAYLVMLAGLFIAGAVTHASSYGANHDVFRADRVWLYAVILTVGYMLSRGFAKSGSRDPYTEER
jgi:hypothetical protein